MTLGVVRVLTSDDEDFVGTHGRAITARYAIPAVSRCIPGQPHGIHDAATEAVATPKIVALARELVADGAGCVLISCAADPALAETRAAVDVPVVGAGSAAASVALGLGGRIGVLGLNDAAPRAVSDPLGDRLVASARPDGVRTTTDLLGPGAGVRALDACRRLVDAGADVILFACTGLTTIGLADTVRAELGVPAVDAVLAAGLLASYAMYPRKEEL
ncbi:MAG TPA: aspartate/glutamate racemase family protein [Actinocatenispora sp.]